MRRVTGINVIAQERVEIVQLVQPDRAIPQNLLLMIEDVVGCDHPAEPEVRMLVYWVDTKEADALPVVIYEGPARASFDHGVREDKLWVDTEVC